MNSTRTITRLILALFVLCTSIALSGCEDTKLMEMFDSKKKLPGDRKEVFPGGQVPGVQVGVPPELTKGYQAPVEQNTQTAGLPVEPQGAAEQPAEPEKKAAPPKPKRAAKPKPKPQPVAASAPQPQQAAPQQPEAQPAQQQDPGGPAYAAPRPWPGATPAGPPSDRFSR